MILVTGAAGNTGSEVVRQLAAKGIRARVISMPCWQLFEEQPADYREAVLPRAVRPRLAVETGVTLGWHRWVGPDGDVVGVDRFGASAPAARVMREFGFTAEQVAARAERLVR